MTINVTGRRDFLKSGILGMGGLLLLPSCLKNYNAWQFLTEEEARCLSAVCEQIIPTDEYGPGAASAGVVFYIDKQLNEVFRDEQEDYRNGISLMQKSANQLHGMNFEDLGIDQQKRFLEQMEQGENTSLSAEQNGEQSAFFRKMVQHTMQGFYGSPRHGGNRNYISYRLMKLDYPYIVGQNRYRDLKNY